MRLTKQEWRRCHEYALKRDPFEVPYQELFDKKAKQIDDARPVNKALRREFADDRYRNSGYDDDDNPPW